MGAVKMRLKSEAIQVLMSDLQWDEMEAIKFMVLGKEIPGQNRQGGLDQRNFVPLQNAWLG